MIEFPIPLAMFATLFAFIFLGIPVAFSLLVTSAIYGYLVFGDVIGVQAFNQLIDVASRYVLAAVPMFIFMGAMLERSRVAERLFFAMNHLLKGLPGGVSLATILMCAVFAAGTGIVGAVEVLVGLITIPAMMRLGYARTVIAGSICAGGSLGTMIPPSIVVVIYSALAQVSIAHVFAAVLIPGVLMVVMFVLYLVIHALIWPEDMPRGADLAADGGLSRGEALRAALNALLPPVFLIVAVIGSILAGIASPTEAAGIGCLGVVLITIYYGDFTLGSLRQALVRTVEINAMVGLIVAGGTLFAGIFLVHGGNAMVSSLVSELSLGENGLIALLLGIVFLLGCVLDWVSVVLIAIPIFMPILNEAGVDPVWFGTMAIIVIQTSYLTPPMAPAIFYLRSIAPPSMTYGDMYRGVAPFVMVQLLLLALIWAVPATATFLPKLFFD